MVGIPGRVVRTRTDTGVLEHGKLPDPEMQEIGELRKRVEDMETQLRAVLHELDQSKTVR